MKRVVCIVAVMFLAVMFIGCASTSSSSSSRFGTNTTSSLKGKTEGEIISQFGKPYKKYTSSKGVKILEYRQSTQDSDARNKFLAVVSYGFFSGQNSAYVDIMKIYLKKEMVTKATFEENVQSITTTGSYGQ